MKAYFLFLILVGVGIFSLVTGFAQDTICSKSGRERKGRVTGIEGAFLKLSLPPIEGSPAALSISIPLAEISSMDCPSVILPTANDNDAFIATEWPKWLPLLQVEGSPAPHWGMAHAQRLLKAGKTIEAIELFRKLESAAWNDEVKLASKSNRLDAMIESGQIDEAQTEAKEFAKISDEPAALVKSRYILATTAFKALQKLVADNPRWQQDPPVAREYTRLYNETLDNFLFAPVFYGAGEEDAARSLTGAIALYRFCQDEALALECARDIVKFYPKNSATAEAQKFIESLPETLRAHDPEKDSKEK